MTKPLLVDLFCGAGGASVGYARAGWRVIGVDNRWQPNYPYDLYLQNVFSRWTRELLETADAVHASPPCQAYSSLGLQNRREYPDLVAATRELLIDSGLPYVIENVVGAPLQDPVLLCGTMFDGLRVIRHRLFETSFDCTAPFHIRKPEHPQVFTHDKRRPQYGKLNEDIAFIQVTGGTSTTENSQLAMGIDWMSKKELNQSIPPAYTDWVGTQLLLSVPLSRA